MSNEYRIIKVPNKKLARKEAYSPRSAEWSLYNPGDVAKKLNMDYNIVDNALLETGFKKAVKIREGLIRWKVRILDECKELEKDKRELEKRLRNIKLRMKILDEQLVNIRNLLRLPREC